MTVRSDRRLSCLLLICMKYSVCMLPYAHFSYNMSRMSISLKPFVLAFQLVASKLIEK